MIKVLIIKYIEGITLYVAKMPCLLWTVAADGY